MTTKTTFETISVDQLAPVTGGGIGSMIGGLFGAKGQQWGALADNFLGMFQGAFSGGGSSGGGSSGGGSSGGGSSGGGGGGGGGGGFASILGNLGNLGKLFSGFGSGGSSGGGGSATPGASG